MVMMMVAWNGDNDDDGRGAVVVAVAVAVSMVFLFLFPCGPRQSQKKGSCTWRPTPPSQAFLKAVRTNMRYVAGRPADAARLRQV